MPNIPRNSKIAATIIRPTTVSAVMYIFPIRHTSFGPTFGIVRIIPPIPATMSTNARIGRAHMVAAKA